jgi:DNA-binding MarR family transcriptional regulator
VDGGVETAVTKRSTAGEAFTRIVLQVLEVHGVLREHGERLTAPSGQTPARWQVLGAIEGDPLTASQIGRRMGLTRQAVQRVVNVLSAEHLVELIPNPDHARSPHVALTAKGRAVVEAIHERQARWANELGTRLSVAERKQAGALLERFLETLVGPEPAVFAAGRRKRGREGRRRRG